jgi:hypothetical protein
MSGDPDNSCFPLAPATETQPTAVGMAHAKDGYTNACAHGNALLYLCGALGVLVIPKGLFSTRPRPTLGVGERSN